MESHIHGFGALELGLAVCEARRGGVVSSYACGSNLFPSHFLEHLSEEDRLLSVMEEGPDLCFGGGSHDMFYDSCLDMDGTVRPVNFG